jgi:predicted nuclease with TOPRIM domain
MNYFNNIVSKMGGPNQEEQFKAEIKKRDSAITKLQDKLKKIDQEKDFVNKSYEELEKKYEELRQKNEKEEAAFISNL